MTKLQKQIAQNLAVEAMIVHLQTLAGKFGAQSFEMFLEMNIDAGEHAPAMMIGLEKVNFDLNNDHAKKILQQFEAHSGSDEMTTVMAEIGELFNHEPRFNQLIAEFEKEKKGDSEKLRDFLIAEASVRILEVSVEKLHEQLFEKWQKLETECHHLKDTLERNKANHAKADKKLISLRAQQQALKDKIESGVQLLRTAKKLALTYKHDGHQTRKKKVSLVTRKIDPSTHLNHADSELLSGLLKNNPDVDFFDAVDAQTGKPKIYLVPDPAKAGVFHRVKLKYSLVRYQRKKNADEYRYAVCNSSPLGEGGYGTVYESVATISLKNAVNSHTGHAVFKKKSEDKSRVVKHLTHAEDLEAAMREGSFLAKILLLHSKNVVVDKSSHRTALLMRKFKGKALIDHIIADWVGAGKKNQPNVFTIDQRLALTIMVGEAIMTVHASGIIHRDIKGDNVIVHLDKDNNPLSANVADFGSAKLKDEITPEHVGTSTPIDYRAPEVIRNSNPSSDEKSDAFSFATLLKELIWNDVMRNKKFAGLEPDQKFRIYNIMKRGTKDATEMRASLAEIVSEFKSIQTERLLAVNLSP